MQPQETMLEEEKLPVKSKKSGDNETDEPDVFSDLDLDEGQAVSLVVEKSMSNETTLRISGATLSRDLISKQSKLMQVAEKQPQEVFAAQTPIPEARNGNSNLFESSYKPCENLRPSI